MNDEILAALSDVLAVTEAMGLRALLVGAWARDLCLPETHRGTARQTSDVDLTVPLDDWAAVDALFEPAGRGSTTTARTCSCATATPR